MSVRNRLTTALAFSLLAPALGLSACGREATGSIHPAHGIVRSIDPAKGEITIEHGEIPGLMKAMTMTFEVEDVGLIRAVGVGVGDEVDFSVKEEGGTYLVSEIEVARP